jgi:hypothetical protein
LAHWRWPNYPNGPRGGQNHPITHEDGLITPKRPKKKKKKKSTGLAHWGWFGHHQIGPGRGSTSPIDQNWGGWPSTLDKMGVAKHPIDSKGWLKHESFFF